MKLYLAFWSLQLYDVDVPSDVYKEEIKRISTTIKELRRAMDEKASHDYTCTRRSRIALTSERGSLRPRQCQTKFES